MVRTRSVGRKCFATIYTPRTYIHAPHRLDLQAQTHRGGGHRAQHADADIAISRGKRGGETAHIRY